MPKKMSHQLRYDGATAEQVYAMLADPEFREAVCRRQRVLRHEVSVEPHATGMRVRVEQVHAAQGLPSFATRIVGNEITIVQEEDWSSATEALLNVVIPGKPGEMVGKVKLAETDGGVTESVEVDIKVRVPLVAGKIEDLISGMLQRALEAENAEGREYLARG